MVFLAQIVGWFGQVLGMSFLGFNVLDGVIGIVILFYAYEGFQLGFVIAIADLLSFVLSFLIALKFYNLVGALLISHMQITPGFANALGFFILAFISEVILNILVRRLLVFLPPLPKDSSLDKMMKRTDHYLGIVPGIISALIVLAFMLSVVISLPSERILKDDISASKLGSLMVDNTSELEKTLNTVFGGAIHETLNFMTIEPKSNERVDLHFTVQNGTVDAQAEEQMLSMVNKERTSRGLQPLIMRDDLRQLARSYSQDMFANGYFSHINLQGQTPFERMQAAGISYTYAGENLALAPNTDLAMQGLMNSPGHKANILDVHYHHIGIGVVDGGIYGKMFTQEFTD